jgi:uncharacterized repeat protein (TIGR02543 family)
VTIKHGDIDVTDNYAITPVGGVLTVTKGAPTYTAPAAITPLTYNGTEQTLISAGISAHGTFRYRLEGQSYGDSLPKGKGAGSYTVYWKFTGDANHSDIAEQSFNVEIAAKEVTVSGIGAVDKTYDGTTNATLNFGNISITGKINGDDLSVTATGAFDDADASDTAKNVTLSGLSLTGDDAGNYALAATGQQASTTAKINRKSINISVAMQDWVYDGTDHAGTDDPVITGNTSQGAESFRFKKKTDPDNSYSATRPVDAGTYTVEAKVAQTTNYNEALAYTDFTISKVPTASITLPAPTHEDETISGKNDGKISNVDDTMEYCRLDTAAGNPTAATLTAVPAGTTLQTVLTDKAPGYYFFRYKADDNHEASAFASFQIKAGSKLTLLFSANTTDASVSGMPANQSLDYNGIVAAPAADPARNGYGFGGWYKEPDCITAWNFADDTVTVNNTVIYAKWTPTIYTITYNLGGGTVAVNNPTQYTIESAAFTLNNPTREHYSFKGWSGTDLIGSENQNVIIAAGSTGIRTYTANWTPDTYNVALYVNEGTINSGNLNTYIYGTVTFLPTDVTRVGYTFNGWFDNDGLAGYPTANISADEFGDKEYWAGWTINQYTITFNTDGGTYIAPITQNYGTAVTAPADPVKDGYTFLGWDTPIPAVMPLDGAVIKALWEQNTPDRPAGITTPTYVPPVTTTGETTPPLPPEEPEDDIDDIIEGDDDDDDDDDIGDDDDELDDDFDDEFDDDTTGRNDDDDEDDEDDEDEDDYDLGYFVQVTYITPSDETREKVRAIAEKMGKECYDGLFWDINLFRTVNGEIAEQLYEVNEPIVVSIELPEDLRALIAEFSDSFSIVRIHGEEVELLDCQYDANTGILTFRSDKFSDYAMIYSGSHDENPVTGAPLDGVWPCALLGIALMVLVRPLKRGKDEQ